jgi:UDP-N-acetylglucosamine acyltransferase
VLAIDPTARVAPNAVIGSGVKIGPYCVVGPNVAIGDDCELVSQVSITGHTTIGVGAVIYPFASLGTPPQSVHHRGGPTRLVIGAKCQIREGVTMNTGTEDGGGITTVGDNCFMMAGSHVAHDCHIGNNVVFANNAVIGGHVEIGDYTFLGGHCVVLQRIKIGESVMVAGNSSTREDVVPFGYVLYATARLAGLNLVGMKRRGIARASIHAMRAAYRGLFETEGLLADRIARVDAEYGSVPEVARMVAFLRASRRPMQAKPRGNNPDLAD